MTERYASTVLGAAVALLLTTGGAWAGVAQDRIFALSVLEDVATGEVIVFDHRREVRVEAEALPPIADGRVEIMLVEEDGRRQALVTLQDGERVRRLNPFPADGGNPLLIVFMETAVRGMASLTGGSPFYIRNRMRDAVRRQDEGAPVDLIYDGRAITGEQFRFRPFSDDPNRDRMGSFADLEISFVVSDDVPGHFAAMSMRTASHGNGAPLLAENMALHGVQVTE
jgi:hypothetical protein